MGLKLGLARTYLGKWYISGSIFRVFEVGFVLLLRCIQNEVCGFGEPWWCISRFTKISNS